MKIKKIACLLMVCVMIWMTASCHIEDGTVAELTDPSGIQQTAPVDSGSDGPNTPDATDPSDVTDPSDTTDPGDSTEPIDPSDITEPTDSADPAEPAPPVVTEPGHEHAYSKVLTGATCTADGFATYTCTGCGDSYIGETTPATGHQFGDWTTTREPTEDAEGTAERTCSTCGGKEAKVLDKLIPNHTHSYTGKVTKAATCSAEGVKTFTCSCGSSYTESIAKTAHNYSKKETWPTCYAQGYMTYTCRNCGYSYKGDYKDKVDHSYSWEDVEPTCEEQGYNLYMCDYCLTSYRADFIPATGHKYVETIVAPTCSEKGYTLHECSECGKSYKDGYTDTVKHDYIVTAVREPSMSIEGYTTYTCTNCGNSYKGDFVPVIPQEEFEKMVADATLKYINQFRLEQGDTEAVKLPGLTNVAQYRAVQLQEKFEHSITASREAFAYYQYGEWVDMTDFGYPGYYTANAKEAIGKGTGGSSTPADELGRMFAEDCRNSAGHWAYVGSSEYTYIGVGTTYSQNGWRICILQTTVNYG